MATYSDLKNQLQALIDRSDARSQSVNNTTIDMLDSFLERAEKDFYRSEAARIPPMEKVVTYTLPINTDTNELVIPGDYFNLLYMTASSGNIQKKLRRVEVDEILNTNTDTYNYAIPLYYAYGSNNWILPSNAQVCTVRAYYHGNLTDIKTAGDTDTDHWLLNNGNDVLLYLGAVEAAIYFDFDATQLQVWSARAEELKKQIIRQFNSQKRSGGTTRIKSRYRR